MRSFCVLLAYLSVSTINAYKSYKGYQVVGIIIDTQETTDRIFQLIEDESNFDIWREARRPGDRFDVMVAPAAVDDFKSSLGSYGVSYIVLVEDVGVNVDRQMAKVRRGSNDYSTYLDLDGMEAWIDTLQANFSSMVTILNVGQSYEGRTIRAVRISTGGTNKPAVWIDSCIHSREWLACASNTYMIQKLLENYGTDPDVTEYLDNIDVYSLPVFNVDGYVETWEGERYWRKTRSPNPGSPCLGTDPNRNWDFHHCEKGSSTDPCTEIYCGSGPFSEIEVATVASYISSIPNLHTYVAMHCYGNWWMSVYGHFDVPPPDHEQQMSVCNDIASAMFAVNGEVFECGTIASFVGRTSGSSVDWAREHLGVKYNWAPELRGDDFVMDESNIIPSGEENYAALLVMLRTVREETP